MNLSIIRTTPSGRESLNIKDASENIAYAVLRRFLPEQKDALTSDPIHVKVQQMHEEAAATDTTGIEPFRVPLDTAVDLPEKPDEEPTERALAKSIIKSAQQEARKQFQEVSNDLKDKLVAPAVEPTKGKSKYHKPKVIHKNGMDFYTVDILCGACGKGSSSLVREGNKYTKCRDCGQKLTVEPMYDEPLAANKAGYAFKANAPFIYYRDQKALREEMVAYGADH